MNGQGDLGWSREWLEADGLGGFASGTAAGIRTRRYHALLLAAARPPADRFVLVNGLEAWVEHEERVVPLTSQHYGRGVVHPDGASRIARFAHDPWPRWDIRVADGLRITHEMFAVHGAPMVVLSWSLTGRSPRRHGPRLFVRPLVSGRDPHALHHENPAFRFEADLRDDGTLAWHPYEGVPRIVAFANGTFTPTREWYRNFLYEEERARGLDHLEDLASPGLFDWDLGAGDATLVLAAEGAPLDAWRSAHQWPPRPAALRTAERRRRRALGSPLHRAADAYIVRRGSGRTIVAGYPWFGDWGRDTFIALRGLCLATGRFDDARQILIEWASAVSEGMLPNRFPDRGEAPEYNSVDACLWYVIAAHEYMESLRARRASRLARIRLREDELVLRRATEAIVGGCASGTRYGIRMDEDGLLTAGAPGVQLTWMDAKVGDWIVTPRIGKPVEVQALWINALRIVAGWDPSWSAALERAGRAFEERFWNESGGFLYDVVDADGVPGKTDEAFRPNQVLAVGGLPWPVLGGVRAARVVEETERRLVTPLGLRSLAPGEAAYVPRYSGGVAERDGAYHQGTVWPWLMGPFVEAWVRVHGGTVSAAQEADRRFVAPLLAHLEEAGLGHVSEIADAESPFTPRGCPFQAWSVGEALRLTEVVLAQAARCGVRDGAATARTAKSGTRSLMAGRAAAAARPRVAAADVER